MRPNKGIAMSQIMGQMMTDVVADERLSEIASALANGLIVIDNNGHVVWIDERARHRINGDLQHLDMPIAREAHSVDCFISTVQLPRHGQSTQFCVLQQVDDGKESKRDLIAAVETIMSDSAFFTRAIMETLRAWRQAKAPAARWAELEMLTHREREILALICDGKSDVEMSRMLNLSQNTIRNHVASLYRKIGVNRRSAAVIWARERT
jgi:DNA-binding CsgD family transcriptional regulator